MTPKMRSLLIHYGVAALSIAVTIPLGLLLAPWEDSPFALFLIAVMVSAWYGGLGPGLFATALAAVSLSFFFLHPVLDVRNDMTGNLRLGIFLVAAVVIGLLNGLRKRIESTLRQQNRMKQECLAILAHELRTPVSTILNAAQMMRLCRPDDATMQEAGQLIERQARTVAQLTNDLVDVARIELGKLQLNKRPIDLRCAVSQAAETARPLIEKSRHQLEVLLPEETLWVEADPLRLEQILINLLGNAVKYTPPGGTIWIAAERTGTLARARVRDTGMGIDPKLLPRIFDLFVQAEGGSRGGLGVGLNLVRQLVELHGGTLTAASEGKGKGSEFTVSLPAQFGPKQFEKRAVPQVA